MPLPVDRPFYDVPAYAASASIGASPVAAVAVAPVAGYIQRVVAAPGGTTTGTITVAVGVNGGADIAAGALQLAPGAGSRNGAVTEIPLVGNSSVYVSEGDLITFTPSGGGGANIPGAFLAVIRAI
ncbi:hypothetical protein [Bradyrhizobium uaiense]|uniref:Uncharacterized protein n=1 Tax=Bradyrhizobium uaiense TaxID=2594946 RepID=A0A6P1B8V2_9BRAD|nr:hypothetical protein [Bradyrhizobium uaiense]NEU94809.1 hypothetical protein [Bradyrhizobium uaiense]